MDKIVIETNLADDRTTKSIQGLLTAVAKTQSFKLFPLSFFPREDGRIEVRGDKRTISFIRRVFSEIGFGTNAMIFSGFRERDIGNVLLAIAQYIANRKYPVNYRVEVLLIDGYAIVKIPDISEVTQEDIKVCIEAISVCDDGKKQVDATVVFGKQEVVAI